MDIPANVKAASDRADALIKQQNGTQPEVTDTPDADTKATGDDKPVTPEPQKQVDDFETKYRTLQGKYNAEIPRLNQQVRTLQEQIKSFEEEMARNGSQLKTNSDGTDYNIDPESLSEYGEEFEVLARQVNQLSAENKQLKAQIGNVTQTQGKSAYDGYINSVAARLKDKGRDFSVLNADPDFLTWLQEPHPFTGRPRHASLQEAEKAMDVERTMRIFDEYLGAASPPKEQQKPKQSLPNVQPTYKNPGSDTNPPMPGSQGRIWTRGEISQFYKDKSTGAFRGREAEFKAIEADMFAAQRDGRIR